ncbi:MULTISPECIES: 3-oxoacyl-ACP synthase III family protein [Streptomyces]|uniref:Ketoacyl-ACP synthase III n=1 Tax=Streptomyces cadmiisoli TaxID=2184053 RepID=A0A2Z4JB30_9ACTN|nr:MULTISPECIES: ketoacyl-ACP synthase III [Streptomyces]AWW42432.1 ketoacyl-ACP synthase III [Streptomyces cadmiisoli]KOV71523.1 3-oxoacyl-ACP synthase [Streptomyces sp. AS58]
MITCGAAQGARGVLGTGAYVPSRVIDNKDMSSLVGVSEEAILRKTAIRERRWAKPEEATSDLAVAAARAALEQAGIGAADLGLIVVATSTPDSPQPATACVVADELGAGHGTAAFDVNSVCSGFAFALSIADRMLAGTSAEYALVIGADVYSRILSPTDRRTTVLFGDGAGAVVLGPGGRQRLLSTRLASFGTARDLIGVPGGGSRMPATQETLREGRQYFAMDGRGVTEFVETRVVPGIEQFLADNGVRRDRTVHFVPHQANGRLLETMSRRLGIPSERMATTVTRYGNTGAASVPITLDQLARSGTVADGDLVLLAAFGGGMSMGLTLLRAG